MLPLKAYASITVLRKGLGDFTAMSFQNVFQSIWALRLGVILAFLPLPALLVAVLYSVSVTRHARLVPEDIWPVLTAMVLFLVFAGACLVPSVLLWSHLRASRVARWVFGFVFLEIVLLGSFIVYLNAR
jgi:hypothetical protein